MATASASAASLTASTPGSRRPIIMAIWRLSACPTPVTDFFTRFAAYSNTGRPARAGANRTTPRAWPSFSVEPGLTLTNVSSTAASTGRCASTMAATPSNSSRNRSASGADEPTRTMPCATWRSRLPSTSITPQPVSRRPGSRPISLIGASGRELRQSVVRHLEIGVDVLDVVVVFERGDQVEQRLGGLAFDRRGGLGPPGQLGDRGLAERLLQRLADGVEILLGAVDLVHAIRPLAAHHVVGAGLDRLFQHLVGGADAERKAELAQAVEHERHAVGLAEIAAVLGEDGAHFAGRAVAVVGERFHDQRHAAGPVALVAHFVIGRVGIRTRAALDGAIDGVARHVGLARCDNGSTKARVGGGIGRTQARGRGDFADQLGEDLRPLGVLAALAVHDVLELRMARHRFFNQIQ